jgi:diaminohydroxyphosphoribosylaminopyrimidine deaminase/5-amino-6-(5-phosphoribosylamino)uracil reductase
MSLDGRLTRPPGEGQWLTNAAARADAHRLRSQVDAILIGAETLRKDNPKLTVRGIRGARQPWRIVVTRSGRLPKDAHLFTDEFRDRTLVYRGKSLRMVLRDLGRRQITSVLIEGGGGVLGEAFDRRLVHRVHFYVAPLLCGGPVVAVGGLGAASTAQSANVRHPRYAKLGDNLCLTGEVEYAD